MKVDVFSAAGDLPAHRWDELAAGSVYAAHGWLRYQETDPDSTAWYVVVSDEGRLVAAASVYVVRREANASYRPHTGTGPNPTAERYVLVGNRRGYSNRLLLADQPRDAQALAALMEGVHALAAEYGGGRAQWMYLDETSATALLPWATSPIPWLQDGDCIIDLPGDCFDDYLSNAPASIRKRVRRDRLVFDRAEYQTAELDLIDCWDRVGQLVDNLERQHGHDSVTGVTGRMLRLQAESMGTSARVDACFRDDVMVGANLRFAGDRDTVSRACGFDYDWPQDACEYFELVYYRAIEAAYRAGSPRLGLGIGTYETKIRRGARVDLRWALVTGRGARATDSEAVRAHNSTRLGAMVASGLRVESLVRQPAAAWQS